MRTMASALVLSIFWMSGAQAEEPVHFEDTNLKRAVEEELWIADPTPSDMLGLTSLKAATQGIGSLVGLEYALNLQTLKLTDNGHIADLSPLAGLTELRELIFNQNQVWDISPLASLVELRELDAHHNQISDISALRGLTKLTRLDLHENPIRDISALSSLADLSTVTLKDTEVDDVSALTGLMALTYLDLRAIPLSDESYEVDIPRIRTNNPGITILHDHDSYTLTISSTCGGSVIYPGEGTFLYDINGGPVRIEARADPGYVFTAWTGTCYSTQNPIWIYLDGDYQICAVFSPVGGPSDAVVFADASLKAAVEDALGVSNPTPTDMLDLTVLSAANLGIESLSGIEYATNLQSLTLELNSLVNLSSLSALTALSYLDLDSSGLSDLATLAGLTHLQQLFLCGNEISDLAALTALTTLTQLDLRNNRLDSKALDIQIPQILANNPGIDLLYDPEPYVQTCSVTLSSGPGGSVVSPGEGTFTFAATEGLPLHIQAKADPGYVFTAWTGTFYSTQNPAVIQVNRDHEILAMFSILASESYVDDDAPDDPSPGDPDAGDPLENGTAKHPFDSIQEAIDAAANGQTILVQPGVYRENITISKKSIHLIGREPSDPNGTDLPVIQAGQEGPIVRINGGNDSSCTLSGFAITSGHGQDTLIGCSGGAAVISHCLITGNRITGSDSALIQCAAGNVTLSHCTIADNDIGECNAGLRAVTGILTMTNSIFYHNTRTCSDATSGMIHANSDAEVVITCSDVEGNWPGVGNIDVDPLFASAGQWTDVGVWFMGDYHLLSSAGRWDKTTSSWLCDETTSPCVDAGDLTSDIGEEPSPNGGIVNMGVYGGTTEASKSN
ncbi:MAG: leucine-rich repeat domain-containing protein [Phycisphaerae bacterium]|nr:leucine-rich repeat domain-containing protein [Phycisphaerae bacterium]